MTDLFEARNARLWLRTELLRRDISNAAFAAALGVSTGQTSNHFARRKNLAPELDGRIIELLQLDEVEATQFRALLVLDRARGTHAPERARAEVLAGRLRVRGETAATVLAQPIRLEAATLRALTQVKGAREDPDWAAASLIPPRRVSEIQTLRAELDRARLSRTPRGEHEVALRVHVRGVPSPAVAGLLAGARQAALRGLDEVNFADRLYGGLFQAMPGGLERQTLTAIHGLVDRVQARGEAAAREVAQAERVFGLYYQLVPLTHPLDDGAPRAAPVPLEREETPDPDEGDALQWVPTTEPASLYQSLDYRRYIDSWRQANDVSFGAMATKLQRYLDAQSAPSDAVDDRAGKRRPIQRQHVHHVVNRAAHAQMEHLEAWARMLGLDPMGSRYLFASHGWMTADNADARRRWWRELLPFRQMGLARRLSRLSMRLLETWLAPTVLELARHPAFEADPSWIRARLRREASEAQIAEAIDLLEELRLLERTETGFRPSVGTLHTDREPRLEAMRAMYRSLGEIGACPDEEAELGLLVQAMPESALAGVRRDLELTRMEVQGMADAALEGRVALDDGQSPTPRRVWMLSLQWLPLSRTVQARRP